MSRRAGQALLAGRRIQRERSPDGLNDGLTKDLPAQFVDFAFDQQNVDALPTTPDDVAQLRACEPKNANPCANAELVFESAIDQRTACLDSVGAQLVAADATAMKAAASATDDKGVFKHWTCVPDNNDGPKGNHHCEYIARAKRLNVTTTDPHVALLCSTPARSQKFSRHFALDQLAPADSTQVPCPPGKKIGTPMANGDLCPHGTPCTGDPIPQ